MATTYYAVHRQRGGPWDWQRGLREQDGFEEHAAFMDALADEGFVVLGGPLENEHDVLLIIAADSAEEVEARLREDNWTQNGMLTTTSVDRWTVLLDGRAAARDQ